MGSAGITACSSVQCKNGTFHHHYYHNQHHYYNNNNYYYYYTHHHYHHHHNKDTCTVWCNQDMLHVANIWRSSDLRTCSLSGMKGGSVCL